MGRLAAGTLTERLSLLNPSAAVPDGRGGFRPGPATTPVVVWAKARVLSGTEVLRLGQVLGSSVVEFSIRYREGVSTATRAIWKGKTLSVRQVADDPQKEFTIVTCFDNGGN